jgi:hypothetical protein
MPCRRRGLRPALQPLRSLVPRNDVLGSRATAENVLQPARPVCDGFHGKLGRCIRLRWGDWADGGPRHTFAARETASCAALSAALLLDAYSLKHKTWCPITPRRQTPKAILHRYGARRAATAWGLDAGLVFTTYRVSSISWVLLALAPVGVTPWWAGLGYAAGFLVPLLLGCSLGPMVPGNDGTIAIAQALATRASAARMTCVAALTIAIAVTGASLT